MKKRGILYIAIAIVVITVVTIFVDVKNGDKMVIKAFADTKFVKTASNVECIINCGEDQLSDGQKQLMLTSIAYDLGIKDGYNYGSEDNENGTVVTLARTGETSEVYIKLLTIEENEKHHNYLMVNVILEDSIESAVHYKQELSKILKEYCEEPPITLNLVGTMEGMLSNNEKDDLTNQLLNCIGAKTVVDGRKENIYTLYGYTESVKEYIEVGKEKVNINIAINYDEENHTTKVYLSTPIINEDY